MLLQTNSYIVPRDRRVEHARLMRQFKQTLHRIGCEQFEVYEQVGPAWATGQATGRFVQIMRFRDRRQQLAVQAAEKEDPAAQGIIAEFCALINFDYQQQQGLFASSFYQTVLPIHSQPGVVPPEDATQTPASPVNDTPPPSAEVAGNAITRVVPPQRTVIGEEAGGILGDSADDDLEAFIDEQPADGRVAAEAEERTRRNAAGGKKSRSRRDRR